MLVKIAVRYKSSGHSYHPPQRGVTVRNVFLKVERHPAQITKFKARAMGIFLLLYFCLFERKRKKEERQKEKGKFSRLERALRTLAILTGDQHPHGGSQRSPILVLET